MSERAREGEKETEKDDKRYALNDNGTPIRTANDILWLFTDLRGGGIAALKKKVWEVIKNRNFLKFEVVGK